MPTSKLSWSAIKKLVYERAQGCCEYCQSCEENTGQAMHIEHINPHGSDSPDNLCLSCPNCNLSKAVATSAVDLVTGEVTPLFNPRLQSWKEHFAWSNDGLIVIGLTPVGRATINRLKMNQDRVVRARHNWIVLGNHPPTLASGSLADGE